MARQRPISTYWTQPVNATYDDLGGRARVGGRYVALAEALGWPRCTVQLLTAGD